MIQGPHNRDVRHALRFIPGAARGARRAYAIQSAAASDLLRELSGQPGFGAASSSKAHSRSLVCAAVAARGVVGVDVEYRAPGRPMDAIAAYLMGAPAQDEAAAYRMFTFREAYFKAIGTWPDKPLLREVAAIREPTYSVTDALQVMHAAIDDDFYLTLVWRAEP